MKFCGTICTNSYVRLGSPVASRSLLLTHSPSTTCTSIHFIVSLLSHCFPFLLLRFVLVLSSHQDDQLDEVIHSRIDIFINISLPGEAERLQMLNHYFDQVCICTITCFSMLPNILQMSRITSLFQTVEGR